MRGRTRGPLPAGNKDISDLQLFPLGRRHVAKSGLPDARVGLVKWPGSMLQLV
jgi:hypothetical protein